MKWRKLISLCGNE